MASLAHECIRVYTPEGDRVFVAVAGEKPVRVRNHGKWTSLVGASLEAHVLVSRAYTVDEPDVPGKMVTGLTGAEKLTVLVRTVAPDCPIPDVTAFHPKVLKESAMRSRTSARIP